jgi:crotonobetainyl-CoA:carnitine CoA-transferase CaiB-like acyl-CoA transferase
VLERPDLKAKHWSKGQEIGGDEAMSVKAELDTIFARRSLEEWTARFAGADCCVTPILRADEALAHPLFTARAMTERKTHATEGEYWSVAPAVKFRN